MKNFLARSLTGTYGVVAFAFIAISSIAGENGTQTISAENTSATSTFPFSGEFVVDETYVGNGDVQRGQHVLRDFDENDILLRFVLTPRIKLGVLRLGAEWERFSFGFPDSAPLPDTLQAVSLVLGLDTQLSDSILLRFQAQPGFYGTDTLNPRTLTSHSSSVARTSTVPIYSWSWASESILSENIQFYPEGVSAGRSRANGYWMPSCPRHALNFS